MRDLTLDQVSDAERVAVRPHAPSVRERALGPTSGDSERVGGAQTDPDPTEAAPLDRAARRNPLVHLADLREGLDPRRVSGGHNTRALVLLGATSLFTQWDDAAFGILLPEIRDEFGVSLTALGTVGVVLAILTLLVSPAAGWLADRVSRVKMTVIGSVGSNLSSVIVGFAPTFPTLLTTRAAGGIVGSLTGPASLPLLTDYFPQERRGRVFAFQGVTGNAGRIVGPLIGGGMGALLGWRSTMILLGALATGVSFALVGLREPVRGVFDRLRMGADEVAALDAPPPVSWGEAWRAAASIATLRRLWYATPFLTAAGEGIGLFLSFYYAEEFGVGPFGRGMIISFTAVLTLGGVAFGGPISDRLFARNPGRIMTLFGLQLVLGCFVIVGLAYSPLLWVSVAISVPLTITGAMILPALGSLVSLIVPARVRGLGLQTTAPWRLLGLFLSLFVYGLGDTYGLRTGMLVLVPIFLLGSLIVTSAGGTVQRDIRAATAASMADEAARRARREGRTQLLVCRDVDVTYDGTQVLFNVDLDVGDGEILALLGTNGAGKSTLLRAIAGVQEASNGAVFLDGRDITHRPPFENAAGGIVFVPGGRAVFPSLTVGDNLRSATWMHRDDVEWVEARRAEVLALFPELKPKLDQVAGTLSGGEQQMVALGQALLMKPRLLMIDELSLGLAPAVVQRLLEAVRRINAAGTTVVLVEQSVNIALTVARRAVFMEKGRILFDGSTEDLLARGDLVRSVFLGGAGGGGRRRSARRRVTAPGTPADPVLAEQVLAVDNVVVSFGGVRALDHVCLAVTAGEIVGMIGPNGAGKTTLFDVISGFVTPDSGTVSIAGRDALGTSPDARARLGLARSFQNARLFPSLTVRETIATALERHVQVRSVLMAASWLPTARRSERRVRRRVEWLVDLLNLDAYADKFVSELSTGSRRMVDLACIMASEPRILLLDEPSSGLAQAEGEALPPVIRRLVGDTGCGVLVIEHDIPLVTGVADRLIAMELGRPIADGHPDDVIADPGVVAAYLGASQAVIRRSGALPQALAAAGIAHDEPTFSPTERTPDAHP